MDKQTLIKRMRKAITLDFATNAKDTQSLAALVRQERAIALHYANLQRRNVREDRKGEKAALEAEIPLRKATAHLAMRKPIKYFFFSAHDAGAIAHCVTIEKEMALEIARQRREEIRAAKISKGIYPSNVPLPLHIKEARRRERMEETAQRLYEETIAKGEQFDVQEALQWHERETRKNLRKERRERREHKKHLLKNPHENYELVSKNADADGYYQEPSGQLSAAGHPIEWYDIVTGDLLPKYAKKLRTDRK